MGTVEKHLLDHPVLPDGLVLTNGSRQPVTGSVATTYIHSIEMNGTTMQSGDQCSINPTSNQYHHGNEPRNKVY